MESNAESRLRLILEFFMPDAWNKFGEDGEWLVAHAQSIADRERLNIIVRALQSDDDVAQIQQFLNGGE